jgi:phenylacetate-CoA ligase
MLQGLERVRLLRRAITRYAYLPLSQAIQGETLFQTLTELEQTQWQAPQSQWLEVQKTVETARQYVPFYRESPQRFRNFESQASYDSIPLLTKAELRDCLEKLCHPDLLVGISQSETSGSTGIPLRVRHGRTFRSYHEAGQWRARGWYGVQPGDPMLALWGRPFLYRKERWINALKSFLNNILHVSIFELDSRGYEQLLGRARAFRPKIVYGYPSGLYDLALAAQQTGIRLDDIGVKVVGCTAETLYDFQRELLEQTFGCPISNIYGCSEFGAFAHQCPAGRMHISTDHVFVEFLDDQNRPVPQGEPGKVVVTSLHNPEMPLVRYEVGDIGVSLAENCPCGRLLPLMDVRAGKVGQMVKTADGKIFSEELFSYMPRSALVRGKRGIKEFHVTQTHLDRFVVKIVPSGTDLEATLRECEIGLRKVLGDSVFIEFEKVEEIARTPGGKLGFFTSLV